MVRVRDALVFTVAVPLGPVQYRVTASGRVGQSVGPKPSQVNPGETQHSLVVQ